MADKNLIIIASLASAVVHLREALDNNGSPHDIGAARMCLDQPVVAEWIENNEVLLPVRRDGKKFYDDL